MQKQLENLITTTDISLGYTQDDMEIKAISKLLCQLEMINLQVNNWIIKIVYILHSKVFDLL